MAKSIKVLWMSDTPTAFTGFGTVTKEVLARLAKNERYKVACLGWGYDGWPYHRETFPYEIYPSTNPQFGKDTLRRAVDEFQPDIFISLGDLWMMEWLAEQPEWGHVKTVFYFPLDGAPLHPAWEAVIRAADLPITYSRFAQRIVQKSLPDVKIEMIYHGVDSKCFRPLMKQKIKKKYHLENKFVVGCVARNQPRKHLPILIKAFSHFCVDKEDVILYLHTNPEDIGWDILNLLKRYKVDAKTCISKRASVAHGLPASKLNEIYNLFDVKVLPSGGEGFGLPIVEAQAAGVPVIATGYSSCVELLEGRGELIKVKDFLTTGRYNIDHAIPDTEDLSVKLNFLYSNPDIRQKHSEKGVQFAGTLDWELVVKQWEDVLTRMMNPSH